MYTHIYTHIMYTINTNTNNRNNIWYSNDNTDSLKGNHHASWAD